MRAPLRTLASVVLAAGLVLAGCAEEPAEPVAPPEPVEDPASPAAMAPQAMATIAPLGDSGVSGEVTFMRTDGGLQVTYVLDGLAPGRHGFHVHENGSCEAGDDGTPGGAAGGHFAPMDDPHGAPSDSMRHVGDFGNLSAGTDGRAAGTFVDAVATLDGATGIVGKAVVVHSGEDDLTTQPSGDSGDRVGCGVIQMGAVDGTQGLPPGHPPIGGTDTMNTVMR